MKGRKSLPCRGAPLVSVWGRGKSVFGCTAEAPAGAGGAGAESRRNPQKDPDRPGRASVLTLAIRELTVRQLEKILRLRQPREAPPWWFLSIDGDLGKPGLFEWRLAASAQI